jgi:F-type H+-transporting ATPase subunit alpha
LKIELAQYRSLQAFAMFASDLDATSKAQLERGARLTELLKQPQYSPMAVEKQVVSIWLGTNGHLDSIPLADVKRFESEFHSYVERHTKVLSQIAKTGDLTDANIAELNKSVAEFSKNFITSEHLESVTKDADTLPAKKEAQ